MSLKVPLGQAWQVLLQDAPLCLPYLPTSQLEQLLFPWPSA